MGRTRAHHIMLRLSRHFPEQHACVAREAERIEREARRGGDNTRLVGCCVALLQELAAHPLLQPFAAQGCPSCLLAVLGRVSGLSDGDATRVALQLAYLFLISGAPVDALMDTLSRNFTSFVALLFSYDTEIVHMTASFFFWAAHLAPDGELIAARLLRSEDFWRRWDKAFFCDKLLTLEAPSLQSLGAYVGMLRACCGVTNVGRGVVISRLQQLCIALNARDEELLQLIVVLRLTSADISGVVDKCYAALITGGCNGGCMETRTFSEACAVSDEDTPVVALSAALESLQKNQFDSAARLKDLHSVARLLFSPLAPPGVAAALLTFLPGALKAVFAAASGVDENVSACACTILASAIGDVELLAAAVQQKDQPRHYKGFNPLHYQKSLVEHFFLLGGVVLLEDLLTDYSNSVVVAALRLLQALLRFSEHSRSVILASRCLDYLGDVLKNISQDTGSSSLLRCGDGESMVLLALSTVTLLGGDAVRLMSENTLECIGAIVTETRSNAKVLKAAIRALTLLAEAYPMKATLILDYEFLNTVLSLGEGVRPSELDAIYLIGYLRIMAVIVSRQPSSVNFEWIETVVLASRRMRDWEEDVPEYAFAFWELALNTVLASEDGSAYLFDDEVLLDVLINALTRCCLLLLPKKSDWEGELAAESGGVDVDDARNAKSGEYHKLLPLLLLVARRSPLAQSRLRQLPAETPYLLEAVAFLVGARKDFVSPLLLVDVVLFVALGDDALFSSAVGILADASTLVVPVLLERLRSFFLSKSGCLSAADDNNSLGVFSLTLALLTGVLKLSGECRTYATLNAVANLVVQALKLLDECLLPFSFYACLLRLLCELLPVDDDHVGEVARCLWLEDNILKLLSSFLQLLRCHEGVQEIRDAVYDTVRWLVDTQNRTSLSIFLRDKFLFLFLVDHVFCNFIEFSCRSLFMSLCAHESFRRYVVYSYRELYCVDLGNISEDNEIEDENVLAALISQCGEGLITVKRNENEETEKAD